MIDKYANKYEGGTEPCFRSCFARKQWGCAEKCARLVNEEVNNMALIMKKAAPKLSNQERTKIAVKAVADALGKEVEELTYEIVGSTYISDNDDSDVDVLVYVEDGSLEEMVYPGWCYGGSKSANPDCWVSWCRIVDGVTVNMLVVTDRNYFMSWLKAADVCRFLHLQGYSTRTASVHGIHEIIMDDAEPEEEHGRRLHYEVDL